MVFTVIKMPETVVIPESIFCPRCGKTLRIETIEDMETLDTLRKSGYVAGARGGCACGAFAVLCIKQMPEDPTFTIFLNIYKIESNRKINREE